MFHRGVSTSQEKRITRASHQLFWQAHFQHKPSLVISYITRIPAFILQLILVPLFTAYALEAIITRNFDAVMPNIFVLLGLTVGYGVLSSIAALSISYNASKGCSYVQEKVFANYLQKDYDFFTNSFTGALGAQATRLRDACNIYGKIITLDLPRQVVLVGGSLLVISLTAPSLAVVTVASMLLILSYTIVSTRWRMTFRRKLSEASSEVDGVVGDALSHATTVKSFATEGYELERLRVTMRHWAKAQFRSFISVIPSDIVRNVLGALSMTLIIFFTARAYQQGDISIAIVTLVQIYTLRLLVSVGEIAELIKTYETVMGSVYQPVNTMLVAPTVTDDIAPQDLKALTDRQHQTITFQNVAFSYPDAPRQHSAIKNFNLTIRPGEKVGLVGFSGSGKTTLTKLLLRFMDVTNGQIRLGDVDIRQLRQTDLRALISYVPQEPLLFHRTIEENIAYGQPQASQQAIIAAAASAHVAEFVEALPQKYATLVGERGVKLSGGQRQRVAIARAILKDAPILVLDEATSALDSESEKLIQAALWELMKERTAIVIAHRLSTIQRMDRIVVMDRGEIVQVGTHAELLRQEHGIYARLWAHQSGGYIIDPSQTPDKNAASA